MLNVKNVKNVIWDKDGTLIDVHIYWSEIIRRRANEIVKKYNLNYALYTDICKMLGLDVDNGRLLQEGPVGVLSRYEILEKLHIYLLDQGVNSNMNINELIFNVVHSEFKPFMYNYVKLLPCIKDTLDKFHQQGIRQYIITSDTSENAKSIADYLGIIKYFKKIWGKDEVRVPKKTGVPALKLMEEENLESKETICIGDTKMDFDMAKNSNCRCVLVATGQIPRNVLAQYTDAVNNVSEILLN